MRTRRPGTKAALCFATLLAFARSPHAQTASSTTTTTFGGTTTTTMFEPTDVSAGGSFEGGFPAGSFDAFSFVLDEPRVLIAEVTNGVGGCPGDSFLELRRPGAPGNCQGVYGDDLPCIAYDDDSGISLCSRLVKAIAAPGEYEIRVSAYRSGKIQRYFLDVAFEQCGNGQLDDTEQCDDGNFASGDCCSPTCTKDAPGTACSDGVFCNGADTCSPAGTCSIHPGDPCPGADGDLDCSEGCDETADACTANDPNGSSCDDGLFCNGTDTCTAGLCNEHSGSTCPGADGDGNCAESCSDSAGGCTGADPQGSPCDDGIFCNGADSCSGGTCSVHAGNPCPGPDGDGNCSETCNETADTCTAADTNGSACDDGLYCNGADTCQAGLCGQHAGDPCPGADGDGNCVESCNEAGDSCGLADPSGSPCNDGLYCNGADTCQSGTCSQHAGNPCPGADGDGNCAESCNEAADSCTAADANGSSCTDGLYCNGADACLAGACSQHAGSPCPGPDGDGNCAESCDESADTCTAADANGSPCDDESFCNGADTCSEGSCSQHAGDPCPGADGDANCSESCSESVDACTAADANASACNDGLYCNGADTCSAGACSQHAGNPCPGADGDGNCAESCDEAGDNCTSTDPEGSPCNDGQFCNGADTCASGSCGQHAGDPCVGADGDGNCAESCSEANDTCTAADSNGSPCDDGQFCNGADTCSGGSCSLHAGSPCAGADGDGNCAESCNEVADACVAADPDGSACDDGSYCNGADTCASGSCTQHAGSPCPGADGDGDCSETCNESEDACTAADTNGTACDDGLFCNGPDTCASGSCAQHAGNPCAGADGDGDCSETCDEGADACTAADTNGSPCNDGLFCNGADTCSAGACSQHAGDPCPGADGDLDCSETCDETAGACSASDPNGTACEDGLICNGSDTCIAGLCNQHSGSVCPGADGDADCSESCSDSVDGCNSADPQGSPCDDGIFCNGADSCSGGSCSVHAGNPCPGPDGDGDCTESCDESADACTAPDPNASACNDGVFCNGSDSCSAGACSVHAGNPCPGPDDDGNCAESCNEAGDACTAADTNGSPCDDGLYCNGADTCQSGACSQHASDPCPGPDGDGHCSESCNESVDACTGADPNGAPCSDGVFCNGADTCSAGACSQHAGSPCPGADGDGNCAESCNEGGDTCTAADTNGSPCNDGLFCNGADTCQAGACSQHANAPCVDGNPCTTDGCSEASDQCSFTPVDPCGPTTTTTTTTLSSATCGDVSGDGDVKAGDALSVLKAAVGGDQCDSQPCVCDGNGNGTLQASDALLVLKAAVGSPVVLLCPC